MLPQKILNFQSPRNAILGILSSVRRMFMFGDVLKEVSGCVSDIICIAQIPDICVIQIMSDTHPDTSFNTSPNTLVNT